MAITVVGAAIDGVVLAKDTLYYSPHIELTLPVGSLSTDWMAIFVTGGIGPGTLGTLYGESAGILEVGSSTAQDLRLSPVNGGYQVGSFTRMAQTAFGLVDDARTVKVASRNAAPATLPTDDTVMIAGVVVLRGVSEFVSGFIPPTNDYTVADDIIGDAGVVIAAVADYSTGTAAVGTSTDWTSIADHSVASTASDVDQIDFSAHMRIFLAPDPVTMLSVTADADAVFRSRSWLTQVIPAMEARPYLRQRQSPRANPRVSLHRPQLRQRQRFQ